MDLIAQEDYEKITWPKRIKMTGRISRCQLVGRWMLTSNLCNEVDVYDTHNDGQRQQIIYLDQSPNTMTEIIISGMKFALLGYKK